MGPCTYINLHLCLCNFEVGGEDQSRYKVEEEDEGEARI